MSRNGIFLYGLVGYAVLLVVIVYALGLIPDTRSSLTFTRKRACFQPAAVWATDTNVYFLAGEGLCS
jgi:hypothetical protein